MKDWWIKFGCFLTGYNYGIVRASSEVTAKAVKKYTSAILIVCILWFFVGFAFTKRYVQNSSTFAFAGAVLMVIIVIQIERQIILNVGRNIKLFFARGMIACLMAVIGSIIIDQTIFKGDIDLEKISYIQERVNKVLPERSALLEKQIASLDTAIQKKDQERISTIAEVAKAPLIVSVESHINPQKLVKTSVDSAGKPMSTESLVSAKTTITSNIPNPIIQLIQPLAEAVADLRKQKTAKDSALLNIRPTLETEIGSRNGFLDELNVMYRLITGSPGALFLWIIWFILLMFLELLVLFSKLSDKENDYDRTVLHQMDLHIRKLKVLAGSGNIG